MAGHRSGLANVPQNAVTSLRLATSAANRKQGRPSGAVQSGPAELAQPLSPIRGLLSIGRGVAVRQCPADLGRRAGCWRSLHTYRLRHCTYSCRHYHISSPTDPVSTHSDSVATKSSTTALYLACQPRVKLVIP